MNNPLELSVYQQNLAAATLELQDAEENLLHAVLSEQLAETELKRAKNAIILEHFTDKDKLKDFGANDTVRDARLAEMLDGRTLALQSLRFDRLRYERRVRLALLEHQHQRDVLRIMEMATHLK